MFISSSGMSILETKLYVLVFNPCPLLLPLSLVRGLNSIVALQGKLFKKEIMTEALKNCLTSLDSFWSSNTIPRMRR